MASDSSLPSHSQSFLLLGQESLLERCAEELLNRGHRIVGIVAPDGPAASYAARRGLPRFTRPQDAPAADCDWLLSITWLRVVPAEVLEKPRKGAINFHDGPLPEHAGLNAPTWALLEGEAKHGISWHEMLPQVDAGAIHVTRSFEIGPDDTSFTLNATCFELGYESFVELLDGIEKDALPRTPQGDGERKLHLRSKRPPAAGHLDWNQSGEACSRLFRALDYARTPNPIGRAWFRMQDDAVLPMHAELVSDANGAPGTVLKLDDEGIEVACSTGALRMIGFTDSAGTPLAGTERCPLRGLKVGDVLPAPDAEFTASIDELTRMLAPGEPFWTKRIAKLEAACPPWARTTEAAASRPLPIDGDEANKVAAFLLSVARITALEEFDVGMRPNLDALAVSPLARRLVEEIVPFHVDSSLQSRGEDFVAGVQGELAKHDKHKSFLTNLVTRVPGAMRADSLPIGIVRGSGTEPFELCLSLDPDGRATLHFAAGVASSEEIDAFVRLVEHHAAVLAEAPESKLIDLDLLGSQELAAMRARSLESFAAVPGPQELPSLLSRTAEQHPERTALICRGERLNYAEFDARVDSLARALVALGATRDGLVGVHLPRSIDLVIAVHAIQRAGAAYLPLDPEYPTDRLAFMLEDSRCELVLTSSRGSAQLPSSKHFERIEVDRDTTRITQLAETAELPAPPKPEDLAYVIYTSGSTGLPKGVQIEHRTVVNFFAGMDERIGVPAATDNKVWLAVTSLSFDISVLELFWTLARGFTVVLYGGLAIADAARPMSMSLAYFASDAGENPTDKYRLLREGARFADTHGFEAVWTPERHFHAFGGLYPNPSVTSAALCAWTEHVHVRAGSVVTGLHHPIRVAEEWSMLDNISNGRVGVAMASGWHPNDFVLAPHRYEGRKERMIEDLGTIRKLWHGEDVVFMNPIDEELSVNILPEPISKELPVWITAAGNPETFRIAGENGCNVLTHLLGQSIEELEEKLRIYRDAFAKSEYARVHGLRGQVTLLLHTYVKENDQEAIAEAQEPMQRYLGSAVDLIKKHVSSWSAVRTQLDKGDAEEELDLESLPPEDIQALLDYAFERYARSSALFGSPESCMPMIERLRGLGVDEIACLIDFGVPTEDAIAALPALDQLRQRMAASAVLQDSRESIEELILEHGVTHLQCTPSMATMLVADETTWPALARLETMLVGGEAVTPELARALGERLDKGKLLDVYGPTETTIWSSTAELPKQLDLVPIGTPIRNTSFWVVDPRACEQGRLVPVPDGVPGELWIGGDGLARGYLGRPELDKERFVPDPFREEDGARLYRTGDLVRRLPTGAYGYLGRVDHQVKIRGYRIELGEIESVLVEHGSVGLAAAIVENVGVGDQRMVAFVSPAGEVSPHSDALRRHLRDRLPEYMVPSEFVVLPDLPRTPNGKIDRKSLSRPTETTKAAPKPAPTKTAPSSSDPAGGEAPASPEPATTNGVDASGAMQIVSRIWSELLGKEVEDIEANFFDLGGHSLLTIQVQSRLAKEVGQRIPLVDLFRFPTIRGLGEHLASKLAPASEDAPKAESRGAQRAARRLARRGARR